MERLKHYDKSGTVRFVTFSCHRRKNLFIDSKAFYLFIESLEGIRKKYHIQLLGYVVMPNHVHLVIYPVEELALGRVVGDLKAHSAFHIIKRWKSNDDRILKNIEVTRNKKSVYALWQRRCYDHNCRAIDIVREKINYCHSNPVRAGLVSAPDEWFWSSYRWYMGDRTGPIEIDDIPLL